MTAVTKTGDWRRARALLAAGPVRLKGAIAVAMRQEAEALRREIVPPPGTRRLGARPAQGDHARRPTAQGLRGQQVAHRARRPSQRRRRHRPR